MSHEVVKLSVPVSLSWNEHSLGSAMTVTGEEASAASSVGLAKWVIRQQEARQDDRLAPDLVGQPAEQDEEGHADRERDRNQDLRRDRGHLQRLRQEEQGVELAAIPDDGFTGGGAEEREDGDLQVGPLTEGLGQRTLGSSALRLHAQEDRRFVELEPYPDRYDQQDGREQERNAPASLSEPLPAKPGSPIQVRMPSTTSSAMNRPTVAVV
jgi:hypothetical protein